MPRRRGERSVRDVRRDERGAVMAVLKDAYAPQFEADPHLASVKHPDIIQAALQAIQYAKGIIPRTSNAMALRALPTEERERLLDEHHAMLEDVFFQDRFSLEDN